MGNRAIGLIVLATAPLFVFLAAPVRAATADTAWGLVWSDECNGAAGTAVDGTKWSMVNQGGGFGNNELEFYTNRTANSYYDGNGNLVIKAINESYNGSNYTSAKLYSQRKGDWTYCKADIRAKLPKGKCLWPAFWMMPTSSAYGGWPECGEIDIMEERGDQPNRIGSTIHFGNPHGQVGASYTLPSAQTFDTAYHNFGMEWEAGVFRFYVDNVLFETITSTQWFCSGANKTTNPYAPFDQNFYMQLNLAIGGPNSGYTGDQNPDNSIFQVYMYIDYVRIYKRGAPNAVKSATMRHEAAGVSLNMTGSTYSVALPFSQHYRIELVSLSGERVLAQAGIGTTFKIRTSGLSPGSYIATVKGEFGTFSDRIVVRKN